MSKNLTRKGLVLGALVALASSVIAGAPAHAAGESAGILVAPNKGTTYNSIVGASFDLSTVLSSSLSAKSNLTYIVSNPAGAALKLTYKGTDGQTGQSYRTGTTAAGVGTSTDAVNDATSFTAKAIVVTGKSDGSNASVDETAATKNHLIVTTSTDSTDPVVLTVQAFLDANHDGLLNNLDAYAAPVTLTFVPAASVTATTTISSATIGLNKLQASVALGNDINMANIPANTVFVQFKANNSVVSLGSGVNSSDATYDSTDSVLKTNISTLASGNIDSSIYIAQAYFGAALATKLGAASNAASTALATNASIDGTDLLATGNSANTIYTKATTNTRGVESTGSTKVRTGFTGAIPFTSYVLSTDGGDTTATGVINATAGLTVRVTLDGSALTGSDTFTAGGKTVSATSTSASFNVLTDSTGKISFTGSASAGTKNDAVTVKVSVLKGSTYQAADDNVLTWSDAIIQRPVLTTGVKGADTNSNIKIAKGGSYTLNYAVADDFGQLVTASGYRVLASFTAIGNSADIATANLVGGVAAITIADASATTGSYTVSTVLQKLSTDGTAWANTTGASATASVENVYVSTQAAAAVSASVPSASQATITKTLVDADLRVDGNTQSAATIGYSGTTTVVSGQVTDATGAPVAGQDVTIAGTGLGFVSFSGLVYKVGSITVQTNSAGNYQVSVFSTTAGTATLTVTAGAATATKTITYTGITSMAETNVLTIDVPALSQVGRSVTVGIKLVDKYGNAVDTADGAIAVSVTGVGSLSAATVGTDSTGKATVQFVAGANDFGDAVITAKYTATNAAATVVTTSKTLTVGVTDAQIDIVNNRVTSVTSFSKGKVVGFYVDGVKKWSKLSASDADVLVYYNLKKGTHTVTVKVSGGFITTEKFIVQ